MKIIYFISIILIISSCNQEKVDSLESELEGKKSEIKELKIEIENLNLTITNLEDEITALKLEKSKIRHYTDDEIIAIVKYEMNFKCPKTLIKDFVVRKTNSDKYEVRFYQRLKRFNEYYWDKIIVHIKVFPGEKYTYDIWDGIHCQD